MSLVHKLHYVDDKLFGYRGGQIFWLTLYFVSVGVLSSDSTTGHQRDYLTYTTLMSCLSYAYYNYNQFVGNPASVPGQHAAGTESLARMLYAAHCGWANIVGWNAIGVWNFVLLIVAGMFGVSKLGEGFHTTWNRQLYINYVDEQKEAGIV